MIAGAIGSLAYFRAELFELFAPFIPDVSAFGDDPTQADQTWHPGKIVFIAVPTIGFYWILRQVLRLFLSNLAQYSDADERIAMIETFLALEGENKLDKREDRILIIQALFRPGPGSSGSDDGSMPAHWFDLLMKRLDPAKPGQTDST
jgi:hypothetical protein